MFPPNLHIPCNIKVLLESDHYKYIFSLYNSAKMFQIITTAFNSIFFIVNIAHNLIVTRNLSKTLIYASHSVAK